MKKLYFLAISVCFSLILHAQVSKTINVTVGSLKTALTATELKTVTNLTITGAIDARDFHIMTYQMPNLSILDLSEVTVAAYDGAVYEGGSNAVNPANTIPNSAFENKSSLTSISIPSSVTSIGAKAFSYCTGLTSIYIPSSVTSIRGSSVEGAFSFTSVLFTDDENNPNYSSIDGVLFDKKKNDTRLLHPMIILAVL